jgi:DNA-binding NtrC family response regulator
LVKVDVRIIAATNKPLEQAVSAHEFREDLFYRLNVVRIQMPPLRERREDIRLLVNYFLKKFAQAQSQKPKSISTEVIAALERYHWPGNVRELENVIQRAIVVAKGDAILPGDVPASIFEATRPEPVGAPTNRAGAEATLVASPPPDLASLSRTLFHLARQDGTLKVIPAVERELIINALAETNGNQVQAAKLLGITRATLRKRVEKFHIKQELSIR